MSRVVEVILFPLLLFWLIETRDWYDRIQSWKRFSSIRLKLAISKFQSRASGCLNQTTEWNPITIKWMSTLKSFRREFWKGLGMYKYHCTLNWITNQTKVNKSVSRWYRKWKFFGKSWEKWTNFDPNFDKPLWSWYSSERL